MAVSGRSVTGSIRAVAIVSHEAGAVGITGRDSGRSDAFASFFASGNFQIEGQQLGQEVFRADP